MKLFIQKIKTCGDCPHFGLDKNITRYECDHENSRFIAWMSNDDDVKIPDWCPLPNCDLLEEKDFEI